MTPRPQSGNRPSTMGKKETHRYKIEKEGVWAMSRTG